MNDISLPDSADEYIQFIEESGHTDKAYLRAHFHRFVGTFRQFLAGWHGDPSAHVLDVGAHWLHQSALFARSGFRVTGADFPATMREAGVLNLAQRLDIELLEYQEIHSGTTFDELDEDSVDVLLFTEILEHITFNPVAFWKAVYRVLKPGGRIVITTPNFYAAGGRAWQWRRFLEGFGSGISTLEILQTPTYGHHWKEYSRREVCHYFCALSRDFHIHRALQVDSDFRPPSTRWERLLAWRLPQLYIEVDVAQKKHGIEIEPSW